MPIQVQCGCGHSFEAIDSLAGGIANCPRCGKAAGVPGLRDPLWLLFRVLVVAVSAGAGVGVAQVWGIEAGLVAAIGLGALFWLISRAF